MKIRIPTYAEYEKLCDLTNENDALMHWEYMGCWVDDTNKPLPSIIPEHRAYRGYDSARAWTYVSVSARGTSVGFRPTVEGLNATDALLPDKDGLVVLGTLYMNGKPVKVPQNPSACEDIADYIPDATLEMRDPLDDPDYQVKGFVVGDDVAIADRVLLKCISYEDVISATTGNISKPTSPTVILRVPTPLGELVAYQASDSAHPGVYIDLDRNDGQAGAPLALVEYAGPETEGDIEDGEGHIVTRVWDNVDKEDYTSRIVHTGISKYFKPKRPPVRLLQEVYDSKSEVLWYCCNACGDINIPGLPCGEQGRVEDLPTQAQLLYNTLWEEDVYSCHFYVMQYNAQFGMGASVLFDDDFIELCKGNKTEVRMDMDHLRELRSEVVKKVAEELNAAVPEGCTVFFGDNTDPAGDELLVFAPQSVLNGKKSVLQKIKKDLSVADVRATKKLVSAIHKN